LFIEKKRFWCINTTKSVQQKKKKKTKTKDREKVIRLVSFRISL